MQKKPPLTEKAAVLEIHVPFFVLLLDGVQNDVGGEEGGWPDDVEEVLQLHEGQAEVGEDGLGDFRTLWVIVPGPFPDRPENLDLRRAETVPTDQLLHGALRKNVSTRRVEVFFSESVSFLLVGFFRTTNLYRLTL